MLEKQAFKFDPNSPENGQGRWRLRDPKDFSRMWTEKDPDEKGISYIVGTLKAGGGKGVQAIRFERPEWSEDRAAKWWSKHRSKYKKLWTEKDWARWRKTKRKKALLELLVKVANYLDATEQYHAAKIIDAHITKLAAEKWNEADHNWNETLIDKDGITKTRGQIKDYYAKNADKILPYLKDKNVIVLLGVGKNKTVLKRNMDDGKRIHITKAKGVDDPESLEYWANRRMVEMHEAIPTAETDTLWIDYDPHSEKMREVAKKAAIEGGKLLKELFPGAKIELYSSGKRGYHSMAFLDKKVDVDDAREKLKTALKEKYADSDEITAGLAKDNQVRADVTTLHRDGSLRAPWSMTVDGKPKVSLGLNKSAGLKLYHGSPYGGLTSFDHVKLPVFFTPHHKIARHYALYPTIGAQRDPGVDKKGPTIYTVDVNPREVIDLRDNKQLKLYDEFRKQYLERHPDMDPDDRYMYPRSTSMGFISTRTGLPQYPYAHTIISLFKEYGHNPDAIWLDESSQDISLALFEPAGKVKILDTQPITITEDREMMRRNEADDTNYADTNVPSFMRLKKIKSPEELLKDYDPKDLIIQEKIDGLKVEAIKDGQTKLFTRRGKDITANVPDLVEQLNKQLPNGTAVLGELSVLVDGKQSISAAQGLMGKESSKNIKGNVVYYVYDVLEYGGKDTTQKPFIGRDKLLRGMLKSAGHIQLLKNYTWNEREQAMKNALEAGGEGLVLKAAQGKYQSRPHGESEAFGEAWKYKPSEKSNIDEVFVQGYTQGKDKLVFPAYQWKDGKPFEVGKVSGLPKDEELEVKQQIDAGKKMVIEVSFQEQNPDTLKYRHMGYRRLRPDKPIKSVKMEQGGG